MYVCIILSWVFLVFFLLLFYNVIWDKAKVCINIKFSNFNIVKQNKISNIKSYLKYERSVKF